MGFCDQAEEVIQGPPLIIDLNNRQIVAYLHRKIDE